MNRLAAYSRLYRGLAEALAEPDDGICSAGHDWPLFEAAVAAVRNDNDPFIAQAVLKLAEIPRESLARRRSRYEVLLSGDRHSNLYLYESLAREGRLAGACTFALWATYNAAGLTVAGSELPDHVSVELAFIAHLIEQQAKSSDDAAQWRNARRLFVQRYACRWLPELGDALGRTGDEVYGPVGYLLAAVIRREMQPRRRLASSRTLSLQPYVPQPDACHLCGFCVQVCPTRALVVQETDAHTTLVMKAARCVSCGQCIRICPSHALQLDPVPACTSHTILRQSPRASCPACGRPTISQAELGEIATRVGAQPWLNYCVDCRSPFLEGAP